MRSTARSRSGSRLPAIAKSCSWSRRTIRYATPNSTASAPNASGTARAATSIAAIAEHARTHKSFFGLERVREPGIARPRPPERGQDEQPAAEAVPGGVVRHEEGDLRDGVDEDEIDEELERGDPLLALSDRWRLVQRDRDVRRIPPVPSRSLWIWNDRDPCVGGASPLIARSLEPTLIYRHDSSQARRRESARVSASSSTAGATTAPTTSPRCPRLSAQPARRRCWRRRDRLSKGTPGTRLPFRRSLNPPYWSSLAWPATW